MCIGRNTENDKLEFDNLLLENSKEQVVLVLLQLAINSHLVVTLKTFVEKPAKNLVHC